MNQDRPVLRLFCGEWSVDVTAGRTWYVGIGSACDVSLPLSGPAEPWFVVRHAGVWSARSVDDRTFLMLNSLEQATDRGVRIGDEPEQELRVRRGGQSVTLRITDPARSLEPAAPVAAFHDSAVSCQPVHGPLVCEADTRGGSAVTAIVRVVDVPSFLGLMSEHRWPGSLTILATRQGARPVRDHAVLLTRTLKVGRSSCELLPAVPHALVGPQASEPLTVFDLLQNSSGRFPPGEIVDKGLLLTTSGTLLQWQRQLERSRELVLSPPPPISGQLKAQVAVVDLPGPTLLPLLVEAVRRLLSGAP